MKLDQLTDRVTKREDGIYCWYYELDMFHNLTILMVVLKIVLWICLMMMAFAIIISGGDTGAVSGSFMGFVGLVCLGMILLTVVIYYITALLMHGRYRMNFAMNEKTIGLYYSERTLKLMGTLASATSAAGRISGRSSRASRLGGQIRRMQDNAILNLGTLRQMSLDPEHDLINLREVLVIHHMIFVRKEDYDFVRDWIIAHSQVRTPEEVGIGQTIGLMAKAASISLVSNLLMLGLNLLVFKQRESLLFAIPLKAGRATEEAAFGLSVFHYPESVGGDHILLFRLDYALWGFILLTVAVYLLLKLLRRALQGK